jgi:hypothetical protein
MIYLFDFDGLGASPKALVFSMVQMEHLRIYKRTPPHEYCRGRSAEYPRCRRLA